MVPIKEESSGSFEPIPFLNGPTSLQLVVGLYPFITNFLSE